MRKPKFYTRAQYFRDCETQRAIERNDMRKREELVSLIKQQEL